MPTITTAAKEAYSSATVGVAVLQTLEFYHPSWASTVRLVHDRQDLEAILEDSVVASTFPKLWPSDVAQASGAAVQAELDATGEIRLGAATYNAFIVRTGHRVYGLPGLTIVTGGITVEDGADDVMVSGITATGGSADLIVFDGSCTDSTFRHCQLGIVTATAADAEISGCDFIDFSNVAWDLACSGAGFIANNRWFRAMYHGGGDWFQFIAAASGVNALCVGNVMIGGNALTPPTIRIKLRGVPRFRILSADCEAGGNGYAAIDAGDCPGLIVAGLTGSNPLGEVILATGEGSVGLLRSTLYNQDAGGVDYDVQVDDVFWYHNDQTAATRGRRTTTGVLSVIDGFPKPVGADPIFAIDGTGTPTSTTAPKKDAVRELFTADGSECARVRPSPMAKPSLPSTTASDTAASINASIQAGTITRLPVGKIVLTTSIKIRNGTALIGEGLEETCLVPDPSYTGPAIEYDQGDGQTVSVIIADLSISGFTNGIHIEQNAAPAQFGDTQWAGVWSAAGAYNYTGGDVYDVVAYNGDYFRCISDVGPTVTTPATDTTHWFLHGLFFSGCHFSHMAIMDCTGDGFHAEDYFGFDNNYLGFCGIFDCTNAWYTYTTATGTETTGGNNGRGQIHLSYQDKWYWEQVRISGCDTGLSMIFVRASGGWHFLDCQFDDCGQGIVSSQWANWTAVGVTFDNLGSDYANDGALSGNFHLQAFACDFIGGVRSPVGFISSLQTTTLEGCSFALGGASGTVIFKQPDGISGANLTNYQQRGCWVGGCEINTGISLGSSAADIRNVVLLNNSGAGVSESVAWAYRQSGTTYQIDTTASAPGSWAITYTPSGTVTFTACAFSVVPPQQGSGRQELTINIDNVSRLLMPFLEAADLNSSTPVIITNRVYLSTDLTQPAITPIALELIGITANLQSAQFTAVYADWLNRKFPRYVYKVTDFPGLRTRA